MDRNDELGEKEIKPFLRWAGGKQFLIKYLLKYIPKNLSNCSYFEPFLGAGSLFFALKPKKAVLSDLNEQLISCYCAIIDSPKQIYTKLLEHKRKNCIEYYYHVRNLFNKRLGEQTIAQATRFIYLNRTSFNGIFRVNTKGFYNVPYDENKHFSFPSMSVFRDISKLLSKVEILKCSYEKIAPMTKKNDFIYIDPPYPPLNGTSFFNHYTKDRFPLAEQKKVANFAHELSRKGCRVLISNAETEAIRKLYNGWNIESLEVTRVISAKSCKHKVRELIITNY